MDTTTTNAAPATPVVNASPVSPVNVTEEKEGITMENNARKLNRSADRRAAVIALRNAIIAAAPAYMAALLTNAPVPTFDNVTAAAAAYAASLSCTKNGEKVDFVPVPAALLVPAAITLVCKGTKESKRFVWDVKGVSFIKNAFTVDKVERSEKCKEGVFVPEEKDYIAEKGHKVKSEKPAWKVVYSGYSLEKKVAYQEYKAEKQIAKLRFDAAAPVDKKFTFIDFDEWYASRPAA